ncbi:hypothetical protein VPH35_078232 [Triticum aestivum]
MRVLWLCNSEMLAIRFRARACEVRQAPSLPIWSVDHCRAARRRSPCGSELVRVQSGKCRLFPCNPSTMPCNSEMLDMRFRARARAIWRVSVHVQSGEHPCMCVLLALKSNSAGICVWL